MRRKKKRLKSEKKNAAYKSIWGNRPRNTNYKFVAKIGPKTESTKMNSERPKKNSGITRLSFSRMKLTSLPMTHRSWPEAEKSKQKYVDCSYQFWVDSFESEWSRGKLDGLLTKSGRSKQKLDNLLSVNWDRSLSFPLNPLLFVLETFTFTFWTVHIQSIWTVHFHSERTVHIYFLDSPFFLVLDRPLSPRTILRKCKTRW